MSRTAQIVLACRALELPDTYEPVTKISVLMSNVGLSEIITCLRSSEDGNAMLICAYYDKLNPALQKVITIDHLIAAARCKDPYKMAGIICEFYSKAKAIESQMIAATASPEVMSKTAKHAKSKEGFQHAKLLLETSGVKAIPVNQKNILIGNRIDNSKNLSVSNINVDPHDRVIDDVSAILGKMTSVPSRRDLPQDSGDTEGQEDKAG